MHPLTSLALWALFGFTVVYSCIFVAIDDCASLSGDCGCAFAMSSLPSNRLGTDRCATFILELEERTGWTPTPTIGVKASNPARDDGVNTQPAQNPTGAVSRVAQQQATSPICTAPPLWRYAAPHRACRSRPDANLRGTIAAQVGSLTSLIMM